MHKVYRPHHLIRLTLSFVCVLLCVFGRVVLNAQPAFANSVILEDDANLFDTPISDYNYKESIYQAASLLPYTVAIYTSFYPPDIPTNSVQNGNSAMGRMIVIKVDASSNSAAITGDEGIPLSINDYQNAQDAFSSAFAKATADATETASNWSTIPPYVATAIAHQSNPSNEDAQDAQKEYSASMYAYAANAAIVSLGLKLGVDMSSVAPYTTASTPTQNTYPQDIPDTQSAQPSSPFSNCTTGFTYFTLAILAFFVLRSFLKKRNSSEPQTHTPLGSRWEGAKAKPLFRDPVFRE